MTPHEPTKRSLLARLRSRAAVLLVLLVAASAGWFLRGGLAPPRSAPLAATSAEPEAGQIWTCAMHPQIRSREPGKCPICGMELIPVKGAKDGAGSERRLELSAEARALIRVRTHPVERRFVEAEVRMVGKIGVDETRLAYLTAWAPGRLDRLFVDYAGVEVAAGDHMVNLYSPKIYTDQTTLLAALEAKRTLSAQASPRESRTVLATLDAARERLHQLGLTQGQIEEIEARGTPSDHITIYSPIGGVVIDKNGQPGMYVQEGTRIYTIADLSHLWVLLDAYESDLAWLHYGQAVEFTTEAYPGEIFHGTIAFIARELDPVTLTVKVRVNLDNPGGRLKPGLFVRAVVRTRVATEGRVMDPDLSGKWICSMHPEIVRDGPGTCDVCGMDLVTTESLGYVPSDSSESERPLVIPVTAPLRTGRRAVVYVELEGEDGPVYEGREVLLGPRAGDWYLVKSGLEEGERVVTHGNFKLDSALQILARPSMMSPEDTNARGTGGGDGGSVHETSMPESSTGDEAPSEKSPSGEGLERLRASLGEVWDAYLRAQAALSEDRTAAALAAAREGDAALERLRDELPSAAELPEVARLDECLVELAECEAIEPARDAFERVSKSMRAALLHYDPDRVVYEVECPMALGRSARWLQATDAVQNPYLGTKMPTCGTVLGRLGTREDDDD